MERTSRDPPAAPPTPVRPPDPVQRWRLTVRRRGDAPVLAQREWQAAWEAAIVAAGLPLAMAEGAGAAARPRLAIAAPLTQGMAAERELLEVLLVRRLPVWHVREALTGGLPDGHELVDLEDVWLGEPAIAGRVIGAEYEASLSGWPDVAGAVDAMLAATELPRQRVRGDRTVDYDLRPFLDALALTSRDGGPVLRMRLRHDPEKGVGRPDEVLAELAARVGGQLDAAPIVRTGLVLAPLRGASAPERPPGTARQPGGRRR